MLDKYKKRLREIDENLLDLLNERVEIAKEIGKIKQEKHLPIRNYEVEKKVISKMKRLGNEKNLDAEFVENITKEMIKAAVEAQEEDYETEFKEQNQQGKTASILGGQGNMGRWFSEFLHSKGFDIQVIEEDDPLDLDDSDLILVSVPQSVMEDVINDVIQKHPDAPVVEISSMKKHLHKVHENAKKEDVDIISIHPMFGPDKKILSGQNLILCKNGSSKEDDIKNLFIDTALNVIEIPLDEHDDYMDYVLALPHIINLGMANVLSETDNDIETWKEIGGTTFNKQLDVTEEVAKENAELYHEIQYLSDNDDLITEITESLKTVKREGDKKDSQSFKDLMKRYKEYMKESRKL